MATTGLLFETDQHAEQLVEFAEAMIQAAAQVRTPLGNPVSMRVGIHSGRVMSGIVGTLRSRYCLFGGMCYCAMLKLCGACLMVRETLLMSLQFALLIHQISCEMVFVHAL
jgi:class 3 adenylate cyclase